MAAPGAAPTVPVSVEFPGIGTLFGLDVLPDRVNLHWRGNTDATMNRTAFVHLVDHAGRILAQHDGIPAGGTRPTRGWSNGETIIDEHPLSIPTEWSALAIGLYDAESGERVKFADGTDSAHIPRATIDGRPRP
jgi:hypothetical protein